SVERLGTDTSGTADTESWPCLSALRLNANEANWMNGVDASTAADSWLRSFEGEWSMSITHSKPQQQTLSIRVSESLREFLELSRQVIANGRGDAVSISDGARILVASAKEDRLDFRLEVAELQQSPTSALGQVRRKWEQQQLLSRAEWVFLAQYVQVACEELSGTTRLPSPDSFIALLEALLAVRSLRTDRGGGLDGFFVGNLGGPVATVFSERQFDPKLLPHAVADLIQDL